MDDGQQPSCSHNNDVSLALDYDDFVIDLDKLERDAAEEKFKNLLDMFPDACTVFLRAKCAEFALDNNGFGVFVENMMIPGTYPKKNVVNTVVDSGDHPGKPLQEKNNNITKNEGFHLEDFLKKYPDPINHFSSIENGFHYIWFTTYYLLTRHRYISAITVRMVLRKNNYNLYRSHLELSVHPPNRKIPRRENEVPKPMRAVPKDVLDQVLMIENEATISTYLSDRLMARARAVEEARKSQTLLTCGCCFADDLLTEEVMNCSEGCIFCKQCILRSSEILMGDGKIDFPCLEGCPGYFEDLVLKEILPANLYENLQSKLQAREVKSASIDGLESCPFCDYCAIPPEETRIFDCDNCQRKSCRLCRKASHIPLKCSEVDDEKTQMRVFVEEKMTEALLRTCYKCGTKFLREDGCNKMVCVCGAKMCYVCRKPITGYSHFNDNSRDQRHSVDGEAKKCPLWSNNKVLHEKEVITERDRALNELKRQHPNVNINMDLLKKKKL